MRDHLPERRAALVLAPMQAVTDLPFMRVQARRGAPDWFVTEYFRAYPKSVAKSYILRSVTENDTGRPVFAQLIGGEAEHLVRMARGLLRHEVAGIDLNLGCPAPIVCRKNAGGGLLRNPAEIDGLLGALRDVVDGCFTVKTRIGFGDAEGFADLLELFRKHGIDGLTVHGRTVKGRYQTAVDTDAVRMAVETMACPVVANGNVVDVETGLAFLRKTGAAGLMIGRGAIRNPWIFSQLAAAMEGREVAAPTHRDLLGHVLELSAELGAEHPDYDPLLHVQRMKKTMAFITHGLCGGEFEYDMRRVKTLEGFHEMCGRHLSGDEPLPPRPPEGSKLFCGFEDLLAE
ncbi:MAG: tRNA dihydrouridine synthase [Verrucomicrobiales bacterium]|nr:tRNA-dihydrouridine synthase family protein [Verrucomicrobiota bacterium JB025]